ncbi:MAG: DUF4435 domain-containing protein [Phycisphaerae bacterium]|nr:DUF4435 domain-containing protein [Phycisphaerae bacterium]
MFWLRIFPEKRLGKHDYIEFKAVGGEPINQYLEVLLKDNPDYIVAIDSDYRDITSKLHRHRKIVETKCYSIENILLCDCKVTQIIKDLARNPNYSNSTVVTWLENYDNDIVDFIRADLIGRSLGRKILPENCDDRFYNKATNRFGKKAIKNRIMSELSLTERRLMRNIRMPHNFQPRHHSPGHFFFSTVLKFINIEVKKLRKAHVSYSKDSLFTHSIDLCHKCKKNNSYIKRIRRQAKIAVKSITIK